MLWRFSAILILLAVGVTETQGEEPAGPRASSVQVDFFETSVRPLLIAECGQCHGEKKQWGGLRLDSRAGLLKGGDSGPAITPGDPEKSLLISAVRRIGDYEMPPEKPLGREQVAVLERWIAMGAPWPESQSSIAIDHQARQRTHWAFQPLSHPVPPVTANPAWCRNPIDQFILSQLQQKELGPAPQADRRTLIRRMTYDLTGLPPSPEEVQQFVADPDPDALLKLIDRLLDSPRYGEHWGRKWLDLARYADTKGYTYAHEQRRFVHSAAYRDWVVNAFNRDLPYDRFLLLQISADQDEAAAPADLAAMGFLTLGRRFLGNEHDIIDDRIDVLGRTTMGLTLGCARCHDHKFDPIPIDDYYSLYGVFQNSLERLQRAAPPPVDAATPFETELRSRQTKLNEEMRKKRELVSQRMRSRITDYLLAALHPEDYPNIPFSQILAVDDLFPSYVDRLHTHVWQAGLNRDPVFAAWHRFATLKKDVFAGQAPRIAEELQQAAATEVSPLIARLFVKPPSSMEEVARRHGELFTQIDTEWRALVDKSRESGELLPTRFPADDRELLRQFLYGPNSPCDLPDEGLSLLSPYLATRSELTELWPLRNAIDDWLLKSPEAPAFSVTLVDRDHPEPARIFRRGNPMNRGDLVPRRFPQVVAGPDGPPFAHGSGRRELALGIVSPENPLTARVWVNRIWQHHFGTGIVPTPSDFGTRAPLPTHLALLDWLADQLIESGWSTKAIHRQILLSSTYQQQASGPEDLALRVRAAEVDPENQWHWRMNLHRLTFEEMRDSMLAVTGELDLTSGGPGRPLFDHSDRHRRRTLYGDVDRQFLPAVYRVFDFANPDLHLPARSETIVPQQALFALNHPFVAARATHLTHRFNTDPAATPETRLYQLYASLYQRAPTPVERQAALDFVLSAESEPQPVATPEQLAWQYGYGSVNDAGTGTQTFQPLPFFNGTAWQGGTAWPDAALGWAQLTAEGGHPGNDHQHAVIRRWTAPRAMSVSIDSVARHEVPAGNGIRCWILSSRSGLLQQFTLHHSSQSTKLETVFVQAGETLDFVVDIYGNLNSDQYLWSIRIQERPEPMTAGDVQTTPSTWDSRRDFLGPATPKLSAWAQLTQVLLLSNEFLFID